MITIQKSISKVWLGERILNGEAFKFIRLLLVKPKNRFNSHWAVFNSYEFLNNKLYRKQSLENLRNLIRSENDYNFNASVVGDKYKETYFVFIIPEEYQTKEILKDLENFFKGFDNIIFACEVIDGV